MRLSFVCSWAKKNGALCYFDLYMCQQAGPCQVSVSLSHLDQEPSLVNQVSHLTHTCSDPTITSLLPEEHNAIMELAED